MTPTQLSLKKLRAEGYYAQVVEHWNPFAHIRQDLFGFVDIIGVHPQKPGTLYVQTTSTPNMGARLKKGLLLPAIRACVMAGNRVVVWGWSKRGPRGGRKVWEVKEEPLTFHDL